VSESKVLKQRPTDAIREVPLAEFLVARLADHFDCCGCADGKVFLNGSGRPVTTTNYHAVWSRGRAQIWQTGHQLAGTTVYDLRHSAVVRIPAALSEVVYCGCIAVLLPAIL